MIKPKPLKKGDKIAIVAPARKTTREDLQSSIEIFESWGLEVALGNHLYGSYNQFSGTDAERLEDLQNMIDDKNIKAIFSARGGYGVTRILEKLKIKKIKKYPKWICGFSDVTALLSLLHNSKVEGIHCIMPALFSKPDASESVESLRKILFGEPLSIVGKPYAFNRQGMVTGKVVGGNLSMICNQTGTSSDLNTKGKILFIEDLDEYLYHIDRMIVQLKRSGKLSNLKGLVVGQMSDMKDNAIPFGKNAYEIIKEHTEEYSYPVCFDFPVGHTGINMAIPIGRKAQFEVSDQKVSLHFDFKS